ncbi:MAG: FAD-binding oxidoreductase [Desulfobulbaceae bacterium]|nr:FAD-binding oxidoreductase [Candidatus Kapabacteria bacterium]MBS4000412.1 FAD-binding oxidoreductase [Desulfobulbaceae bacterium]
METTLSFGNYPKQSNQNLIKYFWYNDLQNIGEIKGDILPYGLGKSYGDSCLIDGGTLLDISGINKFINYDEETGILTCYAGATLADCIDFLLPRGRFLPVTPGTKYVTLGGAIANDVHGKNHHKAGTFGCHVTELELLRSDGTLLQCSKTINSELFAATIGGLGLTGIITKVSFQTVECPGPIIESESIKFRTFEEFFDITQNSENYNYTVAWVDTSVPGRGLYNRGNFAPKSRQKPYKSTNGKMLPFPLNMELINPLTVKAFNTLYYNKQLSRIKKADVSFEPFFYPLDAVDGWNKAYGKKGFVQYQFVIPFDNYINVLKEIFNLITRSKLSSFLTVLKTFGNIKSPGMMSFPREGVTLAIDFKMIGDALLKILDESDNIVNSVGGVVYPCKDARMSPENFKAFYPQWTDFAKYIDPKFSSSFWKRVTKE